MTATEQEIAKQTQGSDPLSTYLAEYNALTTRITYWITLQYIIYTIVGSSLAFFATKPDHANPFTYSWAFLLLVLLFAWAILQTQDEIVSMAVYLEKLRPFVLRALPAGAEENSRVWRWEVFLQQRRRGVAGVEKQYALLMPFGLIIGYAVCSVARQVVNWWPDNYDSLGIVTLLAWIVAFAWVAFFCAVKMWNNRRLYKELGQLTSGGNGFPDFSRPK